MTKIYLLDEPDESFGHDPASTSEDIRLLNDDFRINGTTGGGRYPVGQFIVTRGVHARGPEFVTRAIEAVRAFNAFTDENDPFGEHDFGNFELDGVTLNWKIDYYDKELEMHSPNAADPSVTKRVLTIMLAEEY